MPQPVQLPKMMIGFIVRRCTVALGHDPSPTEFAEWANACEENGRIVCLFGRPISAEEARLILRHRGRPVSARSAAPHEILPDDPAEGRPLQAGNVTSLAEVRARMVGRMKARR